ncbi:MAG: 2,4-dihydroxyhept-2-ene-1,7-dioic acid aldolase [bacterium]|nr:2,4-dihydroxyhept-2-ene-1,7-dioic acid aldolase [bacterium]
MAQNFKERLRGEKHLIGTLQALPCTEITEILVAGGFDWLWVDMEHSAIDVPVMQRILQTAQPQCPCIVRAPSHDEVGIKKILDAGADGIILPQVNSAKAAEKIVRSCKYPPEGSRSVGLARAHSYGTRFQEHVDEANNTVAVVMQIEHIDAVRNIDEIVAVSGVDAVIIGPYDLSGSMGKTGMVNAPEVQEQIEKVRKTCLNAAMPMGIFTADPEQVTALKEKGYKLITMGIDSLFLGQALKTAMAKATTTASG